MVLNGLDIFLKVFFWFLFLGFLVAANPNLGVLLRRDDLAVLFGLTFVKMECFFF